MTVGSTCLRLFCCILSLILCASAHGSKCFGFLECISQFILCATDRCFRFFYCILSLILYGMTADFLGYH